MIKPERKACVALTLATIALLPITGFAKSKPIMTTDLLQNLRKGEPWDRSVFTATKAVMFQQAASGGTDATSVAKITLSYFTSANCSGTGQGNNTGSVPNPSYTTPPDGTSYTISVGTSFGLVATSVWNVGNAKLGISDANMANIQSIAVTFKSTNNNTPQSNFTGSSFACVPVTCTAGPSGQCISGSGTQSFQLKTIAAVGDPADGGVIGCQGGDTDTNLVVPATDNSTGIAWGGAGTTTGATSVSNGSTNTATIITILGNNGGISYAAQLCSNYAATGGYTTDWFLPATNQLTCFYTNKDAIGQFQNTNYWTSKENSANAAARVSLIGGNVSTFNKNTATPRVRCSRRYTP